MNKHLKLFVLVAVALLVAGMAWSTLAQDDSARKDKILANLKVQFPQLDKARVSMGNLAASPYEGLDEGTFLVNGRPQQFFVSKDDTKLYMVSGEAIDVSRSQEELAAEIAKREEAEAKAAMERIDKLNEAVAGQPVRGAVEGKVTIVEFSDFQCPYCTRGAATVEQILEKYPNDVKFVFKHFPLGFHPWAKPAAIASHCAANQDDSAFWTLHDKYFADQKQITPQNVIAKSKEYLAGSGIDMAKWSECADNKESEAHQAASAAVDADMALGQSLGVTGTPGFFVNGHFLNGAQPISAFEPLIEQAKNAG
jgi:protein-disulfide isomerase